jgi:hypothetical protein
MIGFMAVTCTAEAKEKGIAVVFVSNLMNIIFSQTQA